MTPTTTVTTNATDVLVREHEVILEVLHALSAMADEVERGESPRCDVEAALDFFRRFADACHHAKEEKVLFPALAAAGMPVDTGPIGVMRHEHAIGRDYVRAIERAVATFETSPEARRELVTDIRGFEALLDAHIEEEAVLFRMAESTLPEESKRAIAAAFEAHEERELGPGGRARYQAVARGLSSRHARNAPPAASSRSCSSVDRSRVP